MQKKHQKNTKNLVGQRFNRLTAIQRLPYFRKNKTYYLCRCDCGNYKIILGISLPYGNTKSCGCLHKEAVSTEGVSKNRLYKTWSSMIRRCNNKSDNAYNDYGGRGIYVCNEWLESAKAFIDWSLDNGWAEGLQIDREDNNGGYTPSNCRYVTQKVNVRNRRGNIYLTYNGRTHCVSEWAEITGINAKAMRFRVKSGWTVEKILTKPLRRDKRRKVE